MEWNSTFIGVSLWKFSVFHTRMILCRMSRKYCGSLLTSESWNISFQFSTPFTAFHGIFKLFYHSYPMAFKLEWAFTIILLLFILLPLVPDDLSFNEPLHIIISWLLLINLLWDKQLANGQKHGGARLSVSLFII